MHLSHPGSLVCSKAVVQLLFIYCFMYLPLFVGVQCVFFVHYFHYFVSLLVFNHRDEEGGACCFAFIGFWMSCYYTCFVTLPHGAVDSSAVCDCGIS